MDKNAGTRDSSAPSGDDDVQRVHAERMDDARYRYGRRAGDDGPPESGMDDFSARSGGAPAMPKPPILAAWLCLAVAWLFLGSKAPFTVFLGVPFDIAALLLAGRCLRLGGLLSGTGVVILGTAGSLVVYIIGLFRFLVF